MLVAVWLKRNFSRTPPKRSGRGTDSDQKSLSESKFNRNTLGRLGKGGQPVTQGFDCGRGSSELESTRPYVNSSEIEDRPIHETSE